jgi:hypothetical protein
MKKLQFILVICSAFILTSCYKSADIQVRNNISQVKIMDVKWGDIYIAGELLPGETSSKITVTSQEEKFPATHNISFVMSANDKYVYLETICEYTLDEDQDLLIILEDTTRVQNPNQ